MLRSESGEGEAIWGSGQEKRVRPFRAQKDEARPESKKLEGSLLPGRKPLENALLGKLYPAAIDQRGKN